MIGLEVDGPLLRAYSVASQTMKNTWNGSSRNFNI